MARQAVSRITDRRVTAYSPLCAVPTPAQWITYVGTDFLSQLSRKQGSIVIVFKSAWHVNLEMPKNRQLLGGFTMHDILCLHGYTHIYCKLFLK